MNTLVDFVSGLVSGATACLLGFIPDTLKVRMQTSITNSNLVNAGMMGTLRNIIKEQGWYQLFRGSYYPMMYNPVVMSVVFSSYEYYKTVVKQQHVLTFWDGVENGVVVGLFVACVFTPVQLVKCIMQSQEGSRFGNSRQCMKHIFRQEGLKGLWRGNFANIMRELPGYAAFFAPYQLFKGYFVTPERPHLTLVQAMLLAPFPGVIGWLFCHPQDVVKSLIQVNPAGYYKKHAWIPDGGFIDCSKILYRQQGYRGFLLGLGPNLLRASYAQSLGILGYQKTRQMLWQLRTE